MSSTEDIPSRSATASLLRRTGTIDRQSSIPLWVQVRDKLAAVVRQAELPPYAPLPSELDLCALFNVSRPVVRAALEALSADGLLMKQTRRGAFVADHRKELDFVGTHVGLFGEMAAKGRDVATRLLELVRREPTAREMEMLRLVPGSKVVHVDRVYLLDGRPIAAGGISFPAHRVPKLETLDLANCSLNTIIREKYGVVVSRSERWLQAVIPDETLAQTLALPGGVPVVAIESVGWLADGTPFEYYSAAYSTRDQRIHLVVSSR